MTLKKSLLFAGALLIAAPAATQDNAAANDANAAVPVADVNATDMNAGDMNAVDMNATSPAPAANPADGSAVDTGGTSNSRPRGFPFGVLGLLGLIGLFGARKAKA